MQRINGNMYAYLSSMGKGRIGFYAYGHLRYVYVAALGHKAPTLAEACALWDKCGAAL